MELKVPRIKTAISAGSTSVTSKRTNMFLELHKLDYERRRLENRISTMAAEKGLMEERVMAIYGQMTELLTNLGIKEPQKKGKGSNKLKY